MKITRRTAIAAGIGATLAPATATAMGSNSTSVILTLYREWIEQRELFDQLAELPGNGDCEWPESIEAERRQNDAYEKLLMLTPRTHEEIAAFTHILWLDDGPNGLFGTEYHREQCHYPQFRLMAAIWRGAAGRDGLPRGA